MKLAECRLFFIALGLIGVLLISSPALELAFKRSSESFSEIYFLGRDHVLGPNVGNDNYVYDVKVNENYSAYLGVNNHLGTSAYYLLYVKLANRTDVLPNLSTKTPSNATILTEFRFLLENDEDWESLLNFSISNVSFSKDYVNLRTISINNDAINSNQAISWDTVEKGYYCQLFVELWVYDRSTNNFVFDNSFVSLILDISES